MPLYWVGATLCLSNFFDLAEVEEIQVFCGAGEGNTYEIPGARNRRRTSARPPSAVAEDGDLQDFSTR
jgi:hypothetical protein